jgi:MFS family permease
MLESSSTQSPLADGKASFTDVKDMKSAEESSVEKPFFPDTDGTSIVPVDHAAERKLVWKFDTRILPVLAVMYLFNSLDKSNLGNAKTDGLEKTLNLVGDQYNTILSVFFVPYVLTAPVLGVIGKKYGPSKVLPIMMICFGIVTTMVVVVKNFGGLMAIRWFLGMSESAFFPLVIYYQTT